MSDFSGDAINDAAVAKSDPAGTRQSDLSELIKRLEAAPEGSRELDARIFCATAINHAEFPRLADGYHWEFDANEDGSVDCFACARIGERAYPSRLKKVRAAQFTSSLESAMSLLPERAANGMYWRFFLERKPTHDTMAWIATTREHGKDGWEAIGHSAALAVCGLAMEVRAAVPAGSSGDGARTESASATEEPR